MFFFKSKKAKKLPQEEQAYRAEDFSDLTALLNYIELKSGINLFSRELIVKEKLIKFSRNRNITSFQTLLDKSQQDHQLWSELMDLLSINETYFYREIRQIQEAIETLKKRPPPYHILSIPSSSGEEVYTIIILLQESGIQLKDINILGVDISKEIINKANNPEYSSRSIHRIPPTMRDKYLVKSANDNYIPVPELKAAARFTQLNLFARDISNIGKFDMIFSRNMFIYFADDIKIKAYDILYKLKKNPDSEIYLGHADVSSKLYKYIANNKAHSNLK